MNSSRILIVEDELLIAQSLAKKLHKLGYQIVDMVSSGAAAIEAALEKAPDLVLMDIVIKGDMDGIDTAEKIYRTYGLPVIYLTAYADEKTLQRAEKTGCYGYILKPFKERELNAMIRMALNKHQQESQTLKSLELAENLSQKLQTTLQKTSQRLAYPEQFILQNDIFLALDNQELQVYYQPLINLHTGTIIGAEALLRWQHPQRGIILPNSFMHLAEETGLIDLMGEWILKEACFQVQRWRKQFSIPLQLYVNLSARQLKQTPISRYVSHALAESNLEHSALGLELPERLFTHDTDAMIRTIHELKAMGVQLSLDDFGTGYSPLSYLQRFPFDTLKIDRCFIQDINHNSDKTAITQAIIQMAHGLQLSIVAKGVETEAEMDFLRHHRCDAAQGYFFCPPIPAVEFQELLIRQASSSLRSIFPGNQIRTSD